MAEYYDEKSVGGGRFIDFKDDQDDLNRLLVGPFQKNIKGVLFTDYESHSRDGNPVFGIGLTIKEGDNGLYYDKVFDLKPGKNNNFKVADLNSKVEPNQKIKEWIYA